MVTIHLTNTDMLSVVAIAVIGCWKSLECQWNRNSSGDANGGSGGDGNRRNTDIAGNGGVKGERHGDDGDGDRGSDGDGDVVGDDGDDNGDSDGDSDSDGSVVIMDMVMTDDDDKHIDGDGRTRGECVGWSQKMQPWWYW